MTTRKNPSSKAIPDTPDELTGDLFSPEGESATAKIPRAKSPKNNNGEEDHHNLSVFV